jgi:DNA-binding MarR family transcriptional regulator
MTNASVVKIDTLSTRQPGGDSRAGTVDTGILQSKLGYQIRMTDRIISKDFFANVGMTQVQFSVLSLIATNQGLSQAEVGESLDMDRASTMAVVNKLEHAGLVEKQASEVDKRMNALKLTPEGEQMFPGINRRVVEHEGRFQHRLSRKEEIIFLQLLTKIRG